MHKLWLETATLAPALMLVNKQTNMCMHADVDSELHGYWGASASAGRTASASHGGGNHSTNCRRFTRKKELG